MTLSPLDLNLDPEAGSILNNPQLAGALNAWSETAAGAVNTLEAELHAISAGVNYIKTAMTGGGAAALDGIDGVNLAGGELAGVFIGSMPANLYFYVLIADSGAAEAVPGVIAPDTNPGTKRWILSARLPRVWAGEAAPTVNDDFSSDHVVGDRWIYSGAVYTCVDDTTGAAVWTAGGAGSIPTGTGFRHVTTGTEDAATKQVENADVATGAAIAESKLALSHVTHADDHLSIANRGVATHEQIDTALANAASHIAAATPHSGHEATANRGAASGYASLNASSKVVEEPASKAQASGLASLNASSLVVENPANATATPTADKIPIADANAHLDTWVSDAGTSTKGKIQLAGQIGGTAASPTVVGVTESGGQALTMGAVADGQRLVRAGTTVVGQDRYEYITLTVDGGGSAIATGAKGWHQFNYDGTIIGWTLLADVSGSIVIDIWKDTYANYPPTVADTITASAKPTLSSALTGTSSTLTGWTTSVAAGDIFKFNVDSCTTITRVTLTLKIKI